MHTVIVLSAGVLFATSGDSRSEKMLIGSAAGVVTLIDLPATVLAGPIVGLVYLIVPGIDRFVTYTVLIFPLGGLQWYCLASLAARWTCGFQKAIRLSTKGLGTGLVLGLLLITGCAVIPWIPKLNHAYHVSRPRQYPLPSVAFEGDSSDLKQSTVVPSLDSPMPEGKNVIWCASFQMAWERLKSDVVGEPVRVENADATAGLLNRSPVEVSDLPNGSYYAAAGYVKDGIADTIRRQMRERFGKETMDLDNDQSVILAYAYLQANVRFTTPFFDNDQPFEFIDSQGQKVQVSSFGIRRKDNDECFQIRGQVKVLYLDGQDKQGRPTEYALDLCDDSNPSQVMLACIPKKETLGATLDDLQRKIAESQPDPHERRLRPDSVLLVPNLRWNLSHHFSELEGADKLLLNDRLSGLFIGTALQTIDFRLDRSGVALVSESKLEAAKAEEERVLDFVFDRPFLIIVKKRGALRPFFVMWVDNAELLSK